MSLRWRLLDATIQDPPAYIEVPNDQCYYAREYVSRGGWKASEANQLISNFKKPPKKKGTVEWQYKNQAIGQFAQELDRLLGKNCIVSYIPSSKVKTDPDYDNRFEETLAQLSRRRSDIRALEVLAMRESMEPYHVSAGSVTRRPDDIYEKLTWVGLPADANHVVLIDDLLTSGAHFRACKRKILENSPQIEVIGAFWAKVVWPQST